MTALQQGLDAQYRVKGDALDKVRARAWGQFLELGLPSRHQEAYQYVKLRSLYEMEFLPSSVPAIDRAVSGLVFVNGHFQPQLSDIPSKVLITPLHAAMTTYGAFLNNQWNRLIKEETDPFALLNAALHKEGVFIYIPPRTLLDKPIKIVNVIEGSKMMCHPRIQLFVGAGSEIDLKMKYETISGEAYFVNQVVDMVIEENARVRYVQESHLAAGWLFDATRAILKRSSSLKTVMTTHGSDTVRSDYRVVLAGENGEAELNGVWQLNGKVESHVHVLIDHAAPHCRSMQLYKGVLNGLSRSSFEGKILVRQAAQKTDAFQLNNNLLLSERANADSKPNLEIFADDVKASHGATVGQLDPDHLFYLKTRGLSEERAKEILVQGYVKEVLDKIPGGFDG